MVVFVGNFKCTRGHLGGHFIRACYAHLSKVVFLLVGCSKGLVGPNTGLVGSIKVKKVIPMIPPLYGKFHYVFTFL